jgi:alkylhydroperoxidase family enzyme
LGRDFTARVLQDYRTAPMDEKLRATLAYLEKVTLAPEQVTAGDARTALAAGASPTALAQALDVLFAFNIMDRLADAMGWEVSTQEEFRKWGAVLLKRGYGR